MVQGKTRLLYAITGHGFGHATRSLAIARQILRLRPDLEIVFSTSVPQDFLARSGAFEDSGVYRPRDYEPGTAESHCFRVDREGTRSLYRTFAAGREERLRQEVRFLREGGFLGVISDVAAIPIAAAGLAGIPSVAVSNFTWDWILSPILEGDPMLAGLPGVIARDYLPSEAYVRLPFHPEAHPFRKVVDVPLVGRKARLEPGACRRALGLPSRLSMPLVLVAIGGLRAGEWPDVAVDPSLGFEFLVVGDLPIRFPPGMARILPARLPDGVGFADLVAAVDVVLGKPGYGMCSECAINGTPMVSIERTGFLEYGELKAGMGRYVPFRELSIEEFFAGRWGPALEAVLTEPRPPRTGEDGAASAAREIIEHLQAVPGRGR